ncbi:MAG: transcriptional regulator [Phenylobacterium sp.]|uniref:ArsR/SmtB family transcription factor n=1 Tax=Phenylobacterium sp. TaxID=1871053 RepID=UPI00120BC911|nr:metalloregulator ArsR/SmtB family transcription factor [Phenylobacterium sp.]TAJ72128.1 MAG: transcriptional regulator [Phenylobacterium sp.]
METPTASAALSALGNERRLQIFRFLVQAGPDGVAAGEIARRLHILQNTLSSSLAVLHHAGLVTSRRDGRSIIYSAAFAQLGELMDFLVEDCCGGNAELCPAFAARVRAAASGV